MSTPSMEMKPLSNSKILFKHNINVDFPDPVLPQIPIFSPGFTVNDTLSKTFLNSALYLVDIPRISLL